ncbi:MAG: translation initiation factor IF-6 [Desulfurococcales archaeon]|nr:translation initiation factor IF-6 [Desulfurococcales archaeon]
MPSTGKFEIQTMTVMGNSNVGVYMFATDAYVLAPAGLDKEDKDIITEVLGVEPIETTIAGTRLIGVLASGNDKGLLVASSVSDEELRLLRRSLGDGVVVETLPSRNNAVGNLLVANSRAALVYPGLEKEALKTIQDVLDVEVFQRAIAGVSTVGSIIALNNRGGLVHPDATDEEIKFLSEVFGVPFITGTVNFGVAFVRTGLVANSRGAIVGEETSGPELARIQMALGGGE